MTNPPPPTPLDSRRLALRRLFAAAAAQPVLLPLLASCASQSDPITLSLPGAPAPTPQPSAPAPTPPAPPPPNASVTRLKSALQLGSPSFNTDPFSVTQGDSDSVTSSFGSSAQIIPPLPQSAGASLATSSQVYGWRRDLWTQNTGGIIASTPVVYVTRDHIASGFDPRGLTALHFTHTGSAFELLIAGGSPAITLIANGWYMASDNIQTLLSDGTVGAPFPAQNTFIRFDFEGSTATRQISVYATAGQGPCALAVAAGDTVTAWDRSSEASMAVMADSYGGAASATWGYGGLFYEAAAALGIPHVDMDQIGGTGYAPTLSAPPATEDPGNAFVARQTSLVTSIPDLVLTAGSINDNNALAQPPLYPTVADAQASFQTAVQTYYTNLRASLPNAVLVALGPWAPVQQTPTDPIAQQKADTIRQALTAAGGDWIFIDNLNGGWINSAGASTLGQSSNGGPYQTGTGNVGSPKGDGNGDIYVDEDGTHPTQAGCLYLGQTRLGSDLRAAISAL